MKQNGLILKSIEMNIIEVGKEVIEIERAGLLELSDRLDESFEKAVGLLANCNGKVVITGMGKSGLIATKIAATLSSTGTPCIFLHPAEAIHGDLGILSKNDIVIGISYSGETDELLKLIPSLKRMQIPIIGITGIPKSTLAKNSEVVLSVTVQREACPLALAPTASTTSTLALGDALAVCLMKIKGFKEMDFAVYHPGGSLGRKLLQKVSDEMRKVDLPTNSSDDSIDKVIFQIGKGMMGLTVVIDNDEVVKGIITDGDLRRAMQKGLSGFLDLKAGDLMNSRPLCVDSEMMINEAEALMMERGINSLIITRDTKLIGILNQRTIKYS